MADKTNKNNRGDKVIDIDHELPAGDSVVNDDAPGSPEAAAAAGGESLIEKLKAENAFYLDRAARVQAEFENYRKRSAKEQEEYRAYALVDALKQILPILDSLDRALKTENASAEDFHAGMELIDRQFHDVLSKLGVEPIATEGQPFDPSLHQAIQMVESSDVPADHVVQELQRGYRIRNRLLRPAMVVVSKHEEK
jgi:molecular chaperone GrpE